MICSDSLNAGGKGWTQSHNHNHNKLLTLSKSEVVSNQGIYNQGMKVQVTTKDIKKGDRA